MGERREYGEREEERLIGEVLREVRELRREVDELRNDLKPKLVAIEIRFGGDMQGPVTLTPTTPGTTATILGFDQTGAPFTGPMPTATFTPDVTTFCTFTPGVNSDAILGTSNGTTNLGVSLTTAEGLALSDTSQIITSGFGVTPPTPVLTTIKLDFTQPA